MRDGIGEQQSHPSDSSAASTCSILLVEDNPMDVDLTCRAFARRKKEIAVKGQPPVEHCRGIQVARDGEEAIAYLRKWDEGEPVPRVILLDLNLPKLNGLEFLHRLKTHPQFHTIPVIVLTTSSEDSDIRAAYDLGANSYIIKPVDFDQFSHVVDHIQIYWCIMNTPPR